MLLSSEICSQEVRVRSLSELVLVRRAYRRDDVGGLEKLGSATEAGGHVRTGGRRALAATALRDEGVAIHRPRRTGGGSGVLEDLGTAEQCTLSCAAS